MKTNYKNRLSQEIENMRDSIVDINSRYTQQQLDVYGYNPNKHWTILRQYEDATGKVPTNITGMLKNRNLLNEERRLAKELEPYNNFVLSYQEYGGLPGENKNNANLPRASGNNFLTDCYNLIKELPKAIIENPKTSATVVGAVVAVPLLLNTGPLADCVSHGGYEMQKYFDSLELPKLVGVASAAPDNVADIPEGWYDETLEITGLDISAFMSWSGGFERQERPLDEPIKTPDEVTELMRGKMYKNLQGKNDFKIIGLSSEEFAIWRTVASEETVAVCPYVALVDTDGNKKPDTLFAMYNSQGETDLVSPAGVPRGGFYDLDGNPIKFDEGYPDYLINPFDTLGSDYSNIMNLLYFKDPSMINFGDKPTAIHWKDAIGKTPLELGLDKYNKPTAAEKRAYKTERTEERIERLVEQGISEKQAEIMVGGREALTEIEEKQMQKEHKTMAKEYKTNPLVYTGIVGLGAAGIYFATRKKSGKTPTAVA